MEQIDWLEDEQLVRQLLATVKSEQLSSPAMRRAFLFYSSLSPPTNHLTRPVMPQQLPSKPVRNDGHVFGFQVNGRKD